MAVLKLEVIEGKVAAVLPPEVLAELGLSPGDSVVLGRAPAEDDDAELRRQIAIVRRVVREEHEVLRELAK